MGIMGLVKEGETQICQMSKLQKSCFLILVQEGKCSFPECVQNISQQNPLYLTSSELSLLTNWFPQLTFFTRCFMKYQKHSSSAEQPCFITVG